MQALRRRTLYAVVVLLFALTSFLAPLTAAATPEPISYVSLGDSIATGTVDYWSSIAPYVDDFHSYLTTKHADTTVTLTRLAHDGDRSNELLAKLQGDDGFQTAVTGATVISICIGGNNLMQAAAIPGFTDIDWALAEEGTKQFEAQWTQIMAAIRALNSDAKIIVMTVYNPYNRSPSWLYGDDKGLFDAAEPYLARINGKIAGNAGTYNYAMVDVHRAFLAYQPSSMGTVTYMYPSWYQYLYRNPHPKAAGQQIITDLHIDAYEATVEPPPVTYHTIAVLADPSDAGQVTGGGQYADGATATVEALVDEGWEFVNWTESSAVVSTEAEYTFPVTADRKLVAHFQEVTAPPPTQHTATVSAITYTKAGQGFSIALKVVDENANPVVGATVTATLLRGDTQAVQFTATTGSTGIASYRYTKASSGTYTTAVDTLSAEGYVWDGVTPGNSYIKK